MVNGVQMPINTVLIVDHNRAIPNPFTHGAPGIQVPAPHNIPTFAGGQRPPNYQQIVLEEQRRRLFEIERIRVQEAQRRAREQQLRLQQQQEQQRRRQEEEQKRAREARQRTELQQRLQAEQARLREQQMRQQRQPAEQQRQRDEQQRLRDQQQRQLQEQQRQHQEQQTGQRILQQLLRNRNAFVTQQTRPGHPNQSVFQVVVDNNANSNPVRPQRPQRSPPRIIELPPDS